MATAFVLHSSEQTTSFAQEAVIWLQLSSWTTGRIRPPKINCEIRVWSRRALKRCDFSPAQNLQRMRSGSQSLDPRLTLQHCRLRSSRPEHVRRVAKGEPDIEISPTRRRKKAPARGATFNILAEAVRFELTNSLTRRQFSRLVPSTTRPRFLLASIIHKSSPNGQRADILPGCHLPPAFEVRVLYRKFNQLSLPFNAQLALDVQPMRLHRAH